MSVKAINPIILVAFSSEDSELRILLMKKTGKNNTVKHKGPNSNNKLLPGKCKSLNNVPMEIKNKEINPVILIVVFMIFYFYVLILFLFF